jgi:hypothetical protein
VLANRKSENCQSSRISQIHPDIFGICKGELNKEEEENKLRLHAQIKS